MLRRKKRFSFSIISVVIIIIKSTSFSLRFQQVFALRKHPFQVNEVIVEESKFHSLFIYWGHEAEAEGWQLVCVLLAVAGRCIASY